MWRLHKQYQQEGNYCAGKYDILYYSNNLIQVYVVAGGYDGRNLFSSTEILMKGGHSWALVQSLPRTFTGLTSVSLADSVLLLGNLRNILSELHHRHGKIRKHASIAC